MTAVIDSPRSRRRSTASGDAGTYSAEPVDDAAETDGADETAAVETSKVADEAKVVEESETPVSEQEEISNKDENVTGSVSEQTSNTPAPAKDAELVPNVAPHDADHTWGDASSDRGHDEWLRENKPPHWG